MLPYLFSGFFLPFLIFFCSMRGCMTSVVFVYWMLRWVIGGVKPALRTLIIDGVGGILESYCFRPVFATCYGESSYFFAVWPKDSMLTLLLLLALVIRDEGLSALSSDILGRSGLLEASEAYSKLSLICKMGSGSCFLFVWDGFSVMLDEIIELRLL